MAYAERSFSFLLLIIVAVFLIASFQYEMFSTVGGVGGAFLPRSLAVILLILVGYYVWSVSRNKSTAASAEDLPIKKVVIKQFLLALTFYLTLFLINKLGMLTTLGLFLIGSLYYFENNSWRKSILIGTVTIICVYFIFVHWLNIILPSGLFI
ncbi:tripartite tricarboxylate transporter TctB family protein [Sporosarcina pasteurii]|uniref:Tripartite tricarboxylate transporter TctB family n=1 Tax=Sporosarcina pasteurii TaxID=1474 RepID=A0A380BLM3_SPOPA|nr:tripartite tricarboxylate transporter TctB family protein [Sporosarcina pasteurii]MDS9470922.1 tripartite tricarboxylate transporter TctB family protein [Sporosarcina pasteurii]QBQ05421.1 tripartite tricarboxylate transporter TctB family protein [Sporosarcina pasteurii]SUJ03294.1 Tripartite tricarboxylate transporter TctB family [Sporosarcina pasteurii]